MNFRWPEGSFPRSLKISIALTSNRNFRLHIQKPMFLYFHTSASNQRFTVIKICAHYVLIFAQVRQDNSACYLVADLAKAFTVRLLEVNFFSFANFINTIHCTSMFHQLFKAISHLHFFILLF